MSVTGGSLLNQVRAPELGCLSVPGGSDLVIWSSTREEQACLDFVKFITQSRILKKVADEYGYLSPKLSELVKTQTLFPPLGSEVSQALLTGRTFPCVPLIGLVEARLSAALSQIQAEVFAHPGADIDALVRSRIEPLGSRLNLSLG